MNGNEKECSLVSFLFLSFLSRVNCISQGEVSRKIKRPSQGEVPYPSTLYIPYLSMYRPRSLARLLADCRVIQLNTYYICYNSPSSSSLLFNTLRYTLFHIHTCMRVESLPQHDGRLKERMNDRFYKFPCKIASIPTPKYFISQRL